MARTEVSEFLIRFQTTLMPSLCKVSLLNSQGMTMLLPFAFDSWSETDNYKTLCFRKYYQGWLVFSPIGTTQTFQNILHCFDILFKHHSILLEEFKDF